MKKLSVIIEEINNRTGNHFDKDVAAQAMLQIKEILLKSQKLQQSALVNSEDEFKFSYFDDIDDALVQGLEQNQDFFSMLLSNPEIKKQVLGVFVTEVYKTLKNKDASKNNVIKFESEAIMNKMLQMRDLKDKKDKEESIVNIESSNKEELIQH